MSANKKPDVSEETLAFFQSLPWAAQLIASPQYSLITTPSRIVKASTEDAFFSQTLATPSTIPHSLNLLRRELSTPPDRIPFTSTSSSLSLPVPSEPDSIWLFSLGSPGVSGHPFIAHGGFLTAVLDEALGSPILRQMRKEGRRIPNFTVRLDTRYKNPVKVPGVYIATSWCTGREGRKTTARGQIIDKDGKLYAEAEGMWVEARAESHL